MRIWAAWMGRGLLLALAVVLAGCLPSSNPGLDEAKEPFYVLGQRKLSGFDYRGAVEAFEKAVEANPQSGSAHFQLGVLYEQKVTEENSYAIAIYHYNKFLQLRPKSPHAEIVKQRIVACKQELAKPIALAPGTQSVLRDIERLKVENAQLKSQLEAWAAYATNRLATPPVAPPTGNYGVATNRPGQNLAPVRPPPTMVRPGETILTPQLRNEAGSGSPGTEAPAMRTHRVQSNETPSSIARKYGISVRSLMRANPGVDERRLKIGQVLNVPAS